MDEIIAAIEFIVNELRKGRLYDTNVFTVNVTPYIFGGFLRDSIKNGATVDAEGRLQVTDDTLKYTDVDVFLVTEENLSVSHHFVKVCDILKGIPQLRLIVHQHRTHSYESQSLQKCMDYCNIHIQYQGRDYDLAFNVTKAHKFETIFDFSVNCLAMDMKRRIFSRSSEISVGDAVAHIQRGMLVPIRCQPTQFRDPIPSLERIEKMYLRGFSLREYVCIQTYFLIDLIWFKLHENFLPPEIVNIIISYVPMRPILLLEDYTVAYPLFSNLPNLPKIPKIPKMK